MTSVRDNEKEPEQQFETKILSYFLQFFFEAISEIKVIASSKELSALSFTFRL